MKIHIGKLTLENIEWNLSQDELVNLPMLSSSSFQSVLLQILSSSESSSSSENENIEAKIGFDNENS